MKRLSGVLALFLAVPSAAQVGQAEPIDARDAREALFELAATADDTKLIALYEQAVRWSARYDELRSRRELDPQMARLGLERLIDEAMRGDDPEEIVSFYEAARKLSNWHDAKRQLEARANAREGLVGVRSAHNHWEAGICEAQLLECVQEASAAHNGASMGALLDGGFGLCLAAYFPCYGPYGPGGAEPFWCPHGSVLL